MRRFQLFVVAAIVLSSSFAFLLPADDANAVSGTCYFNTKTGPVGSTGTCSVPGLGAYGTNDIFTGRNSSGNGDAIPRSVNTKSEFVSYVLNRFRNGSDHNQIGAAFIIQEMRGSRAWPSNANVSQWQQLMNRSDITVKGNVWDSKVGRTSWYDNNKKNVFYADHPNVGRYVINIYQDGRKIAQIEHACGNLVAGAASIRTFDIKPTTQIRKLNSGYQQTQGYTAQEGNEVMTANVGDYVEWRYSVRNTGDDTATFKRQRASKIGESASIGSVPYYYGDPSGNTNLGAGKSSYYNASGKPYAVQRRITASDEGKTICYTWGVNPRSSTDTDRDFYFGGSRGCVRVPKGNYDLKPDVNLSGSGIVESGGVVDKVSAIVDNDGSRSTGTEWLFSKIIVQPGDTIRGAGDSTLTPQQWYANQWSRLNSGTNVQFNPSVTEVAALSNVIVDDLPIGSKLCWALSVKPPVSGQNSWRHSVPKCLTIGKKPKLHINGGDVRVRGDIRTSTSVINVASEGGNRVFGSWAEFGVFSREDNVALASGGSLREGSTALLQSEWSGLTFANIQPDDAADGQFGHFENIADPADVVEYFSNQGTTINGTNFSIDGKSGVYRTDAESLTVTNSQPLNGRTVVIVAPEAVITINQDIRYATTVASLDQLPQVVIIAKQIRIADEVQQLDSWLIASESINTCASVANPDDPRLTAGICQRSLVVNGPVATQSLYLLRTAGAGAGGDAGIPAETINLRPDTYLWGYHYGLTTSRPVTASMTELPPRF